MKEALVESNKVPIHRALRARKILGVGKTQIVYLAEAGLDTLENDIEKLSHNCRRDK